MYIIVFENWKGKIAEIWYDLEEAKKRFWELDEVYTEVHLCKAEEILCN